MNIRCNLFGVHDWRPWQTYTQHTKYLVRDILGHRRPEEDYTTTEYKQKRTCRRCGLTQRQTG